MLKSSSSINVSITPSSSKVISSDSNLDNSCFIDVECKYFSHYDYEDFLLEKEYNNFDENGNRKMKYGELRRLIHDGKI